MTTTNPINPNNPKPDKEKSIEDSSTQPASTQSTLAKLHATLEATQVIIKRRYHLLGNVISFFLNNPTVEINWHHMDVGIKSFLAKNNTENEPINGLRVLISTPDGTVAYDSSKNGTSNTFSNYQTASIGENHGARPEMLLALLSTSAIGNSQRISRTTSDLTTYHAERVGLSTSNPIGISRVSMFVE